jgi:hypothetical protein
MGFKALKFYQLGFHRGSDCGWHGHCSIKACDFVAVGPLGT